MNFEFSEELLFIRDQARNFLVQESTPEVVHSVLDTDAPYQMELWQKIVELGWTATTIPEAYGGLDLGYLELCVIAEELGRSNAWYGAWALPCDAPDLPLAAATARVSATDAYYQITKENIQAHGGMGFTWEFDCQLFGQAGIIQDEFLSPEQAHRRGDAQYPGGTGAGATPGTAGG